MICVLLMFQVNKVQAAETTGINKVVNHKVINGKMNQTQGNTQAPQTATKTVNTKVVPSQKIPTTSQSTTTPKMTQNKLPQKTTVVHNYKNVPQSAKAPAKVAPKMKPQLLASTVNTTKAKPKVAAPVKKVAVAPKKTVPVNTKKPAVAVKAQPKTVKTAPKSKATTAKAKPQLLATTTKSQPVKKAPVKVVSKPKAVPKPAPKVASKPTASNYYNQAPKRWPANMPGGDNVRDFGQTTYASGINDALKIMKASGNKGVSIEHTTPQAANIATVYNWNPTAKALTYGTGTAIGKHTILTANHVVNDQQAHKPMTPSKVQNLRINLAQQGSKVMRTLTVTGVKMMQYGDVALLYTNEDISKYMSVRKIAPEASITNMKANTPIHLYHYGLPAGQFKNDPMGTMYHSRGKYSMMARNVNPIGYYQMMAEPGSSGGAILNSKSEVIGVHAFRIASGEYQKYNLNTMAELRGNLRKEVLKNIK
ncbi:serine protease [Staphylococcus debuckii]|nr:serine protease [Staphylococcus debuckii]